ncbi:phosphate/phosphite/phosphonate ABC transporter substrate-binding protein [Salsuginibacillus kocurii]|uniref:phosphate/phosphite/phosphonate ABC transporter substrate-binding protein n=1 Tax=Salsuginibacillus kocurii TaxID=427078 RepID=UPI00037702D7|nr:phosphate/phosphite/phosphonate ABC transporter substrate-binding protein [Salsuginibacillus kocurii]
MKKWVVSLSVATTMMALAACGAGDEEGEPADDAGGDDEEVEEETEDDDEGEDENGEEAAGDYDVDELTMGFVPSQDADEIATTVEPLAERLEEELGVEIDAEVMVDYSGLVEGMRTQSIDIGFLPPFGFVQAEERADVDVLLKALREDEDSYLAQFNVAADSDIEDIDDVVNAEPGELTWAYGDVTSTAGYLFPASHLMDLGVDVEEHFVETTVGGHDNAIQAVLDGQADIATSFDDARDNFEDENPDIYDEIEVIEYTDPIPNDTISVRSEMDEGLKDDIVDIFLSFNDDEEMLEVLDEVYNWDGITEADSEDYDIVRETYERFEDVVE